MKITNHEHIIKIIAVDFVEKIPVKKFTWWEKLKNNLFNIPLPYRKYWWKVIFRTNHSYIRNNDILTDTDAIWRVQAIETGIHPIRAHIPISTQDVCRICIVNMEPVPEDYIMHNEMVVIGNAFCC